MSRRRAVFSTILVLVALFAFAGARSLTAAGAAGQQAQKPDQQPAFRSGITAVPIDVRVIDNKTGKPVTDLKQEDFTLLENDVVQPIRHFEQRMLKPDTEADKAARPIIRESAMGITPQSNRIFLIVLGRGRLQEPTKALDAILGFVRTQLLPQDQVAVFAYDRATDFTTEHDAIARLIERFKNLHYDIDMEVGLQMTSGLASVYGSRSIPKKLQTKIDAVFAGDPALASKEIGRGVTAATERAEQDRRDALSALQRQDLKVTTDAMNANNGPGTIPVGINWTTMDEIAATQFSTMGLDEFMEKNAQTLQDLGSCYAGVEYLRHLEGEKHLLFVTEKGMYLPRVTDDTDLAAAANDARVAIDTFQTGGLEPQIGGKVQDNFAEAFAFKALRNISELTGGVSAVAEPGTVVMDRLNQRTLTNYVLGYYPSLARFDGSYRKITVKVNRPDTTVLFRHGYYARRDVGGFDRRSFITRDRLQAAAAYGRELKDIKVKMDASLQKVGAVHQLVIDALIDPSALTWTMQNGEHVGSIDIALVGRDAKGQGVGQNYQRADLRINEDTWQKVAKTGIPYSLRLEMSAGVRQVRLIVYDFKADLLGTVDKRVW